MAELLPAAALDLIEAAPLSDDTRALARRGNVRRYRSGTLLIQEGDLGDTLYIILAGRLRAFSVNATNGREITYGLYGPGEYVGEMSLDGGPRAASVITTEYSACVAVTRDVLRAHIAERPEFAFELLTKVIRRARSATHNARQLALNDVYGRLKALLEDLAEPHPDGVRVIDESLTHLEMAQRVGCSREMVTRVFADLKKGEYVGTRDGCIALLRELPAKW